MTPPPPIAPTIQKRNSQPASRIGKKLAALDAECYLQARAERGKLVDIDTIFAKFPKLSPISGDELPPRE